MTSTDNPWIYAGLASSFPDITPTNGPSSKKTKIHDTTCSPESSDETKEPPPCRAFQISNFTATPLSLEDSHLSIGLQSQVLILRYRNKIHAITHECPHRSYPLSRGSLYDIEDFGIVLSAGIVCPKHGWSFDLFTGESDRGGYRLGVWEVQARDGESGEEVWVRKKT